MRREFKIEGMACNHCRKSVEDALNSLEGVKAVVTLDPPVAIIEFEKEYSLEELQEVLTEEGEYVIFH